LERRARARVKETLSWLVEIKLSRELRERLNAIDETG